MYWPDWCHAKFRWLQALCSIMIVKFVNDYGTALMNVNHLPECDAPRVHEFHEIWDGQVLHREAPAGYPQPVIPFSSTATLRVTSLIHSLHAARGCQPLSEQARRARVISCQIVFTLHHFAMTAWMPHDASVILCPTHGDHGVWRWNSAPDLLSRGSSGAGMAWTH